MKILNRIKGRLLKVWLSMVYHLLPRRFKRFIILTTIFKKGYDDCVFEKLNFSSLNKDLRIACDTKAMENISVISTKLWKDVDVSNIIATSAHYDFCGRRLDANEAQLIATELSKMTPSWLCYKRADLIQDIALLFVSQPMVVGRARV